MHIPFVGAINLHERPDRFNNLLKEIDKLKYIFDCEPNIYKFYKNRYPKYGCWLSHIALYKMAVNSDAKFALICEDDIKFNKSFNSKYLQKYITENDWDYVQLHETGLIEIDKWISPNIYSGKSLNARCYLINKKFMIKMINTNYTNEHIDYIILKLSNMTIHMPPLSYDVAFKSDNEKWDVVSFKNIHKINMSNYWIEKLLDITYNIQQYTHILEKIYVKYIYVKWLIKYYVVFIYKVLYGIIYIFVY